MLPKQVSGPPAGSRDKCKWEMEGNARMTDHYTISGHNLDFVKQRNPTTIHPHALPAGPLVHVLPLRQPTAGHNIGQQSHAGLIKTHMHECLHNYCSTVRVCVLETLRCKVQTVFIYYCMWSWGTSTTRGWNATLLAHMHQSSKP